MFVANLLIYALVGSQIALACRNETSYLHPQSKEPLKVETFIHHGPALDMVSTLIIGSQAAMVVDLPFTISSAKEMAAWVRNVTDKPLVAAFTTHFHPDHYLSGGAFLEDFPETKYYANPQAIQGIVVEAPNKVQYWSPIVGADNIVQDTAIPIPFNYSFFALPGDEDSPVHLLSPINGDTIDETIFWIPSLRTIIAGDAIYGRDFHPWLADLINPALTSAWLSTIKMLAALKPSVVIPGHLASFNVNGFAGTADLQFTYDYVRFFQTEIEAKGPDFYTPAEVYDMLDQRFPDRHSENALTILNTTAENFGRGGSRQVHYYGLEPFDNLEALEGWEL